MKRSVFTPIVVGLLYVGCPAPVHSQGYAGNPMSAQRRVEVSEDGKNFRAISEGSFFRDSIGRLRVEETTALQDGSAGRRRVYLVTTDGEGRARFLVLDPSARTGEQWTEPWVAAIPPPAPMRHQHPDDGRKLRACTLSLGPGPAFLERQPVLFCDEGATGAAFSFAEKRDGQWVRHAFSRVRLGEPPNAAFQPPTGNRVQDTPPPAPPSELVQRAIRETLRLMRSYRGLSVQVLLGNPPSGPPSALMNPQFKPGKPCDEFRLVRGENVIWQCPERSTPLLRTKRTG